jgi:hypothetical protein
MDFRNEITIKAVTMRLPPPNAAFRKRAFGRVTFELWRHGNAANVLPPSIPSDAMRKTEGLHDRSQGAKDACPKHLGRAADRRTVATV